MVTISWLRWYCWSWFWWGGDDDEDDNSELLFWRYSWCLCYVHGDEDIVEVDWVDDDGDYNDDDNDGDGGDDAGMTTMMLTAINKCNWLQLEIVGRRFIVACKLKTRLSSLL